MDKNQILNEIKRTTAANGGKPLGATRFFQETGIRQSDWAGKLWARWGDALREAGFDPNQMQSAYDDGFVIEKFITLMRQLGRFPVMLEMRLAKRHDSTFPNDKTFARFGTKEQFAAKIREYCEGRPDHADIIAMCDSITVSSLSKSDADEESEETFGFVYLFKSGRSYKIGHSNSIGRREYELAIQLPEKPALIHAIRTDDPAGIEAYWHRRFDDKRGNEEWFALTAADVKAFKRRKFM